MIYLRERDSAVLSLITAHESACDCCGWVFRSVDRGSRNGSILVADAWPPELFFRPKSRVAGTVWEPQWTPTAGKLSAVGSNVGCYPTLT
jgi:hypothetical protein